MEIDSYLLFKLKLIFSVMYAGPYKYILEIKVYIDGTDGMDDEFEDLQD